MEGYKLLKPIKNLVVRDPVTKTPLAVTGERKPWIGKEGNFWRRRVKDGSCIIVEKKKEEKKQEEKIFSENGKILKKGGK